MVLLSLDLGTHNLGLAVTQDGKLIAAGTIKAPKRENPIARQSRMLDGVAALVEFWHVTEIAMERPWGAYRNLAPLVALHMGIESWAKEHGLPCYSYPVATVRKGVCRSGRVSRPVLALAVRQLYPGLPADADEHQIDCLALAWHHQRQKEV